jgi:hypothetical protein
MRAIKRITMAGGREKVAVKVLFVIKQNKNPSIE